MRDLSPIAPFFEQKLNNFYANNCLLQRPLSEIVKQGIQAITQYFKGTRN